MRAVVITRYGKPADVLQVKEVAQPVPADHQVLLKVHAASLNVVDQAPVTGGVIPRLFGSGLFKPNRLVYGTDVAGEVEAVGPAVTRFRPGDAVFGAAGGSFAEFALAAEKNLVAKPANISFEEGAAVAVGAISALQGLRKGGIAAGQRVLIHGSSGAVGTFAVQIAKAYGAHVTAVCSSRNVENARRLGADEVIDYTTTDFAAQDKRYDLILAVNGNRAPTVYRDALMPQGCCVVVGGKIPQILKSMLFGPFLSQKGRRRVAFMGIASINQADLEFLAGLLAAGTVKPLVERVYPLEQTVEAIAYHAEGHAQGKLVIAIR